MNTSNLFVDPVQTVHFLSLFTYMNKLSDIFYSKQLLKEEDKRQAFPIVNALYEHLNKAHNETEAKQQLVQKLLEGSELYGGNKNETLDIEYVNNTLDYIITNAVFAQSGNLYGYLAEIVSLSTSLKLSVFKTKVLDNLSLLRQLKDNGDVSNLTKLSIDKIAKNILWPLFPNPPDDIDIISVRYVYALAGYNLAKSIENNLTIPFEKCVTLGMTIEASAIGDEVPYSVLQVFALPAMIYYAYNKTEEFDQQSRKNLLKDKNFWSDAFESLFSYLKATFEMIRQEDLESNTFYQFHLAMSNFKNRTVIAREVIQKECKFSHLSESHLENLISSYKTFSSSSSCFKKYKQLPNLELIYAAQFDNIKEKYRLMIMELIRFSFDEFPSLIETINSPLTTVLRSFPKQNEMYCSLCPPLTPTYYPNITFFAIDNGQQEFYAFEQNENNITLLIEKNNSQFNKLVGLPKRKKLKTSKMRKYKNAGENFGDFVKRYAGIKAEEFRQQLFNYGYDKTGLEKFFEIIEAFIPFYHCVKFAKAGQQGLAAMSCLGDIASFIPLAGMISIGFKMSSVAAGRLIIASGITLETLSLRQAIYTTLTTGLREAALGFKTIFTKVILTKQMLKNLSTAVVRSLDPGFELVGKLAWHGGVLIGKVISKTFKYLGNKFPTQYAKYESYLTNLKPEKFQTTPEIPIEGHQVFRFIYPNGKNPYGPKCIRLSKGYAELRRMIGFDKEIPVVSRVTDNGRMVYRRVNLQTQESFGLEMKLNKQDLLENVRQPFREHIYKIKTEGLGGRGSLMIKRDKSIDEAATFVKNANIGVRKEEAEILMRQYLLSVDDKSVDNLMDIELINFDHFKNTEIDDLLKVYKVGSVVDPALNQYLHVPTYKMFALDWVRTRRINKIYQEYYVENFIALENLLYDVRVESLHIYNHQEAKNRITALYGEEFINRIPESVEQILNRYINDNSWKHVKFEDYYALLIWKYNGYKPMLSSTFSNLLKKSLFRIAIRQSTDEYAPKVLYNLEIRNQVPKEANLLLLQEKSVTTNNFVITTDSDVTLQNAVDRLGKQLLVDNSKQIVVHKLRTDSYLTVDMNKIIPTGKYPIILLPGLSFVIKSVEPKIIAGFNVIEIGLVNNAIAKEALNARLMNEINVL